MSLPKYASAFIDNRGKERVRLRRTGWQSRYVEADLGSPGFTVEYNDWLANGKVVPGAEKAKPGSFDDLISRYYASTAYLDLSKSTQGTYRGELERFRAIYGERSARTIQAKHIQTLMTKMAAHPSAAANLRKRLAQLFDMAIVLGWRSDNPARPVKPPKSKKKGGFKTWQETHIAQFEAAHPVGTRLRLLFDLALYTAQRRGDLAVMGPQHVEAGRIRVRQFKTKRLLHIPIHPRLAASIAATPHGDFVFVATDRGQPFAKESLGNLFGDACRGLGLVGYSLHGLRKAASRRMAEIGLSNQMIKSMTGHTTDSEVSRYTRDAEQVTMADGAMEQMAARFG